MKGILGGEIYIKMALISLLKNSRMIVRELTQNWFSLRRSFSINLGEVGICLTYIYFIHNGSKVLITVN